MMRKALFVILLVLFGASFAWAQNTVTITGTVEDSANSLYSAATGNVTLSPQGVTWTIKGVPIPTGQTTVSLGQLNAAATFSVVLTNTSVIDQQALSPQWIFTFRSAPRWDLTQPYLPMQQTYSFAVPALSLTTSQDITSNIQSVATVLPVIAGGGGAVTGVSNSDGTLTVSPTTGAVVASLALSHANTWAGVQTFTGPALGTPASGVITNLTGTCATCGVGGNAATVTTAASSANSSYSILSSAATSGSQAPSTIASFTINPFTGSVNIPGALTVTSCTGCTTAGAWSALTAPTGNLNLSMASFTSIFNTTTAEAQMFAWKNLTAAVVGTSQGSPVLANCGRAFHGSADVEDCMTFNELPGNGNDAAITFAIGHTGTSTGVVTTTVPGPFQAGTAGGAGGMLVLPEGTAPSGLGTSGQDNCYADSTAHGILCKFNNGGSTLPSVLGPVSSVTTDMAEFSGTSGGLLIDSGIAVANLVTASSTNVFTNKSISLTQINSGLTSGGIACATSTTAFAMTAALTANVLPKGGGAGVCPTNSLTTDNGTTSVYTGTGGTSSPVFTSTGATAGFMDFPQGSTSAAVAPCNAATSACFQAPTAVTSYVADVPAAAPTNNFSAWLFSNAAPSVGTFAKMQQTAITSGSAYTNATTSFSSIVGGAGQTLSFAVEASTNYTGVCHVIWQGSASTTGPKFQWTGPASPTAVTASMFSPVTNATFTEAVVVAFSSPMANAGTVTTGTNFDAIVTLGLVNGTNAGTVVLQAAADGTGTLTIEPGSYCTLQ